MAWTAIQRVFGAIAVASALTLGVSASVQAQTHVNSYEGDVIAVDVANQTFTVRTTTGGRVREMEFHVNPLTRLYFRGDKDVLLGELRVGDPVTVNYEVTDTSHAARYGKKPA